jgi:hypothetical protein
MWSTKSWINFDFIFEFRFHLLINCFSNLISYNMILLGYIDKWSQVSSKICKIQPRYNSRNKFYQLSSSMKFKELIFPVTIDVNLWWMFKMKRFFYDWIQISNKWISLEDEYRDGWLFSWNIYNFKMCMPQDVKPLDKIQNWFNQEPLRIILYPTHIGILVKPY